VESLQIPWTNDDPRLAILPDPPCLPLHASLLEALALVRGSLDCVVPAAPGQEVSTSPTPVMAENTGCVLVVEDGRLRGIVTARDLVRLASGQLDLGSTPLAAVMTTPVLSLRQQELTNIFAAIHLLRRHRIRHLPIVDDAEQPMGLVTISSLRRLLRQTFFLRFRRVAEVMTTRVITVEPHQSLQQAVETMGAHAISCLVVVEGSGSSGAAQDRGGAQQVEPMRPVGILTEHDVLQLRALGHDFSSLQVEQVMSGPPICVAPEDELGAVQDLMNRRWVGHVVVTDSSGRLAGIVTETDLTDVLDPLDLCGITEILQKQVHSLREARDRLLADRRLDLGEGFRRGEFRLVYQPQLHLTSARVGSAEALLRWCSPEHCEVPAATFVPLAEQSGFILELGEWVLEQACRQALAWARSPYGPIHMAVNVSGLQLDQSDFVERTCGTLARLGVDPSLIHLELTETVLVENFSNTAEAFRQLQHHGIRIAIDDFGTGYASLSYLQHFSFDILKIDGSFISELPRQSRNQAIVTSIVRLAEHLSFQLVAEGVETPAELALLERMGCPIIQGYAVSPPLEPEDWPAFLAGRAGSSTASGAIHMASP
jgi:EAL domain-containing protein (putative c-di-GMP-specific phosphodiesterase class I)/CBS domain-containing protein